MMHLISSKIKPSSLITLTKKTIELLTPQTVSSQYVVISHLKLHKNHKQND